MPATEIIKGSQLQTTTDLTNFSAIGVKGNGSMLISLEFLKSFGLTSSSSTPSNSFGNDGNFHINQTEKALYKKIAGSWTLQFSLTGPQGTQGATGPQGTQGATGPQGLPGTDNGIKVVRKSVHGNMEVTVTTDIIYHLTSQDKYITIPYGADRNMNLKIDQTKEINIFIYVDESFGNSEDNSLPKFTNLATNATITTTLTVDQVKSAKGSFFWVRTKNGSLTVIKAPLPSDYNEDNKTIVLPQNNATGTEPQAITTVLSQKNVTIVLNENSRFLPDLTTPNHTLKVLPTVQNIFFVIENNLFSTSSWCMPKVINDANLEVEYYGTKTNSLNRILWESKYTGRTVRYAKINSTTWQYIDSNTFTDILTRSATLGAADFQGTLMKNSIFAFTGGVDLTVNLATVKDKFAKNRVYTIVNELNANKYVGVSFGEVPFNYSTATSVIIKRMDASTAIAPEQTEFRGSLRFYINNNNKFVVLN